MGCDGGTIPKRNEIVKNKQKDQARDKDAELAAKWQFCALSGLPLRKPIVACALGRLYNKIAIVEHLLESPANKADGAPVSHIKSLRDVKELKLLETTADPAKNHRPSTTNPSDQFKAHFVCPVSGLDLNGKYKFFYSLQCGCVFSERALKQVPNDKQCLLCSKPYDPQLDLIVLNGDQADTDQLRGRLDDIAARRKQQSKRAHHQHASTSGSSCAGEIAPGRHCATSSSQTGSQQDLTNIKKRRKESSVKS